MVGQYQTTDGASAAVVANDSLTLTAYSPVYTADQRKQFGLLSGLAKAQVFRAYLSASKAPRQSEAATTKTGDWTPATESATPIQQEEYASGDEAIADAAA
jgi:hypothetical protein